MKIHAGKPYPLGSHICQFAGASGVNFALASRYAAEVTLCLFDVNGKEKRLAMTEKTDDVWHIFVENLDAGQRYGFRVAGLTLPARGIIFNPQKLLLDPHAKAIDGAAVVRDEQEMARFQFDDPQDNAHFAPKSVVCSEDHFDWQDDQPPQIPWDKTVIYEMHVKGFTKQHGGISVAKAGTFAGLAEPEVIKYLKDLGVTTIELLPISHHADEPHLQAMGKVNYWGYNVMGHFALDPRFASKPKTARSELKQLVKTLHAAGFEVVLDVIFNHGAEGGIDGATLSQRGIDNRQYYFIDQQGRYIDFSGCGNSFNLANPIALRWAMDALRYWVEEFHVDGFRFDLASVLGRNLDFQRTAPFFSAIIQDPVLSHCKLIAEPWDVGLGGYNLGNFPQRFSEWNGKFRDDLRTFWVKGGSDLGTLATRMSGSADIFQQGYRAPRATINFITAHDGFTLRDLVSYNHKHNEQNGEQNRDGENHNLSFNHGAEGKTSNVKILAERARTSKALLACLLLAHGVPMLLAGDEMGNSQEGNNNGYCQDNPLTWLDWAQIDHDLLSYVQQLLKLRQELADAGVYRDWWHGENARWLRADGKEMQDSDWHRRENRALMLLLLDKYLILFNGNRTSQDFSLPKTHTWQTLLGADLTLKNALATVEYLGVCVLSSGNKTYSS